MQSVYEHSQTAFDREISISSSNRGKHKTIHILKSFVFVYKKCMYIFFLIILVLLNFKFIFLKYIFFKFNNNFLLSLLLACSFHLLKLTYTTYMYTVIRNTKIKKMEIKYIKSQTNFVVPHPPSS